jgi:hypothetical protein
MKKNTGELNRNLQLCKVTDIINNFIIAAGVAEH